MIAGRIAASAAVDIQNSVLDVASTASTASPDGLYGTPDRQTLPTQVLTPKEQQIEEVEDDPNFHPLGVGTS